MVAGIVSVGGAGALGIVANGGEWGGKEQGEDSPGSGFNLGVRTAKADKRVSKPGLGAFFHTGIAGVGFAFGVDRGFDVMEGKEGVIVQFIVIVNAVHCEADIAGVGGGAVLCRFGVGHRFVNGIHGQNKTDRETANRMKGWRVARAGRPKRMAHSAALNRVKRARSFVSFFMMGASFRFMVWICKNSFILV